MRKFTWALIILIVAIWAVIAVYWVGIEKNQTSTKDNSETVITPSPTTVPLATDSSNIATMSSSNIKVVTTKTTLESTLSGVLLTSPTITVRY